jgi:hypothetical protein
MKTLETGGIVDHFFEDLDMSKFVLEILGSGIGFLKGG